MCYYFLEGVKDTEIPFFLLLDLAFYSDWLFDILLMFRKKFIF